MSICKVSEIKQSIPEVYNFINDNISEISTTENSVESFLKNNKNWYNLLLNFFKEKSSQKVIYSTLVKTIIDKVNYNDYTDKDGKKYDYSEKRNILNDAFAESKKGKALSSEADNWISKKLPEVYDYIKKNIGKINLKEDKIKDLWASTDWYDKLIKIFEVSTETKKETEYSKLVIAMVAAMTSDKNPKPEYQTVEMKDKLQSTFSDEKKDKYLSTQADSWIKKTFPDLYTYIEKNLNKIEATEEIKTIKDILETKRWYDYLEVIFGVKSTMSEFDNMNISKLVIAMITVMINDGFETYKDKAVQEKLGTTFSDSKKSAPLSENAESWISSNFPEIYNYIVNNLSKIDDYRKETKDDSIPPSSTMSADLQNKLFAAKEWHTYLSVIFDVENNTIYSNLYYFPNSISDLVDIIATVHELSSIERAGLLELLTSADENGGLQELDISTFENQYDNMFYLINEHCKREIEIDLVAILKSKNWYALLCMAYGLAEVDKSLLENIVQDDEDNYDDDDYGGKRTQLTNNSIWTHQKLQQTQPVTIAGIEFDALISANWNLSATLPNYTVEDGYEITDNIVLQQETMDLTLFLTDTPLTWIDRDGHEMGHTIDTIGLLREMYYKRQLFEVVTREAEYSDMFVKSIRFSKNKDVGYSREVSVSLQQVRVTQAETVEIPESYGKAMPETEIGPMSTDTGLSNIVDIQGINSTGLEQFEALIKDATFSRTAMGENLSDTKAVVLYQKVKNTSNGKKGDGDVYLGYFINKYTNVKQNYYMKVKGSENELVTDFVSFDEYMQNYTTNAKDVISLLLKISADSKYINTARDSHNIPEDYEATGLKYLTKTQAEHLKYYGTGFCIVYIMITVRETNNDSSNTDDKTDDSNTEDTNTTDTTDTTTDTSTDYPNVVLDGGHYYAMYKLDDKSVYMLLSNADDTKKENYLKEATPKTEPKAIAKLNVGQGSPYATIKGEIVPMNNVKVVSAIGKLYNELINDSGKTTYVTDGSASGSGNGSGSNNGYGQGPHA